MISSEQVRLEEVPCDFCGSEHVKLLFRQKDRYINFFKPYNYEFAVVKCVACGLIFVNPRPTRESIGFFYPSVYHDERIPETMSHRYRRQQEYLPFLQQGRKILDIGCAKGDFLAWLGAEAGNALDLYGCDAYSGGVREGYPINFVGAELPYCHYHDASFDCVTSWAVLEHVHNPKSYFAEANRVLKPKGTFVFAVPNFNSLMCRVAKEDDIARHLYQFTPQSIDAYLKATGFSHWNIYFDDNIFDGRGHGSLVAILGNYRPVRWIDKAIFAFHWEKLLKISGTMVVLARKW